MTSVLIVEDQRMPRENMEHLVEDSGRYRRVASLSTAEMALAQCARHTVDLVLMDVCTKGSRDGIDVAAEIKARHPETKVIIITSMVEERPAWGRSAAPSSPPGRSRCCGWCVRGWNMRRSPQSWASPPAP